MRTLKIGPGDVPKVCHTTARFLVIAAPRPSDYQTWMNPGGTSRGALFFVKRRRCCARTEWI